MSPMPYWWRVPGSYESECCRACRRDYLAPVYGKWRLCNDCRFTWLDRKRMRNG